VGDQHEFSLGCKYPEHVVELSDKTKSLGIKNPEHAVVELSDIQKINNIKISSADQRMDLKIEILNTIKNKYEDPFSTDICDEINTVNDRAIYSKQYHYALSASDLVNSEMSRMLKDEIIRPSRSP